MDKIPPPTQRFELPGVLTPDDQFDFEQTRDGVLDALARLQAQMVVPTLREALKADPRVLAVSFTDRDDQTLLGVSFARPKYDADGNPFDLWWGPGQPPGIPLCKWAGVDPIVVTTIQGLRDELAGLLDDCRLALPASETLLREHAFGRCWTLQTLPALHRALAKPENYDPWSSAKAAADLQATVSDATTGTSRKMRI